MRVTSQIPLRFFHSYRADFTLPIQQKALPAKLSPLSIKKISSHEFSWVSRANGVKFERNGGPGG